MLSDNLIINYLRMSKIQKFIYSLTKLKTKNPFTKSDLERHFGYDSPQQDLRKIIDVLIKDKIIVFHSFNKKSYPRYVLNIKRLKKIIRDGETFKINGVFIEIDKPFDYNY